jgi:creatinine amidohydrolase
MRLQDSNWMDVERYLQHDNRIIIIIGATEQHAYLSLLTDVLIPSRIALAAAEREPIMIAPAFNFGVSPEFADYAGTISLSRATFEAVLTEVIESLYHQGFTRFLVLNGHRGNPRPARLSDMQMDGLIKLIWYDWSSQNAAQQFEQKHNLRISHANWGENFAFNRVGDSPILPKPPINLDLLQEHTAREVMGDGSYGGPYQMEDALMEALFDAVVDEVVELARVLKD